MVGNSGKTITKKTGISPPTHPKRFPVYTKMQSRVFKDFTLEGVLQKLSFY